MKNVKEVTIDRVYGGALHGGSRLKTGVCPIHEDTKPSFAWYIKTNSWYCFTCRVGGSVIDLVMKRDKVDFKTAVKFLERYI